MLSILFAQYHAAPVNTAAECREVAEMAAALYELTLDDDYACDAAFHADLAGRLQAEECGAALEGGGLCERKAEYFELLSGIGLCEAHYHVSDDKDLDGITVLL